ncbi:TetR/AcrR family transcriptional regulator [Bacillus sp. XF8]|uniref:TetR/AcrR family transcriptional regulator n=1 Tax=Bacillus sp. XF8 TaxID=2819289 RepID=UPI001AA0751E|nr:TetR/AcrR family transcriptional regulator [Bacillus sp. XF8]MBO1580675.1 TetR family transcriptional regulator [Bacillus sp. XF8]
MNKRRYDSEQAKQVIAEKATELFSIKGYAKTSVEDIAKASGYSKGHIYYHYQNKENLFIYLAQKGMQQWDEKWQTTTKKYHTATEKLYGMARHVLYNYKTPLLKAGQELASDPTTNPTTVQKLYELAITPIQAYQHILEEGIRNDEFKIDDIEKTSILLGSWLGGLCQFIYTVETEKLKHLFEEAITIFLLSISKKNS